MTGSMQVLIAGGGQLVVPAIVLSDTTVGGSNPQLNIFSNGAASVSGNASSCVPPSWFVPNTTGIGSSFWGKLTVNSGSPPVSGAGTLTSIASPLAYQWLQSGAGTKVCNATFTWYYDAGGTQVAQSTTFNVTAKAT